MIDQLTCEETFRQLDDFIDRELSENETRRVQKHLEICAVCAKEFDFEADVWSELRSKLQQAIVPSNLKEKLSLIFKEMECFELSES